MQQGTTITSEFYCKTLKELRRAIQKTRRGVLLHDIARPHIDARSRTLLERFNWELFDHSPRRPYLAQNDYNLFTYLKSWLG
jgi:hypothetical protein